MAGKNLLVRFDSKKQLAEVKRAAKAERLSANSFIVRESTKAAAQAIQQQAKPQQSVPQDAA